MQIKDRNVQRTECKKDFMEKRVRIMQILKFEKQSLRCFTAILFKSTKNETKSGVATNYVEEKRR